MKTHIKLLKEFLSYNGITALFLHNMKHYNKGDSITTIEELISYMHKNNFPIRQVIFLAFYWNADKKEGRGTHYWNRFATAWRKKVTNL